MELEKILCEANLRFRAWLDVMNARPANEGLQVGDLAQLMGILRSVVDVDQDLRLASEQKGATVIEYRLNLERVRSTLDRHEALLRAEKARLGMEVERLSSMDAWAKSARELM